MRERINLKAKDLFGHTYYGYSHMTKLVQVDDITQEVVYENRCGYFNGTGKRTIWEQLSPVSSERKPYPFTHQCACGDSLNNEYLHNFIRNDIHTV